MKNRNPMHRLLAVGAGLAALTASPGMANAENPYTKPDGSWISISGQVESVSPNFFRLDFGAGTILVEMDDGDRDADAYKLIAGDRVTVNGRIDDDFFETTKIEASSVYVEKLGTYFYASSRDEEDRLGVIHTTPIVLSSTVIQGIVTRVGDEEFVLDIGPRSLTVDVTEMAYNPLDDEGYQQIRVGDEVRVGGEIDEDLFGNRELEVDYLLKLDRG